MIIKVTPKKFFLINKTKTHIIPRIVQFSVNKLTEKYLGTLENFILPLSDYEKVRIENSTVTAFHNYEGSIRAFIVSSIEEHSHTVILVKVPETPFWRFWYFINTTLEYQGYLTSEDLKNNNLPLRLLEQQILNEV